MAYAVLAVILPSISIDCLLCKADEPQLQALWCALVVWSGPCEVETKLKKVAGLLEARDMTAILFKIFTTTQLTITSGFYQNSRRAKKTYNICRNCKTIPSNRNEVID